MELKDLTPIFDKIETKLAEHAEAILSIEQKGGIHPAERTSQSPAVAKKLGESAELSALREKRTRAAGVRFETKSLLPPFETKNTVISSSATNPPDYLPGIVGGPVQRVWLRQFLPTVPASAGSIVYTKEDAFTNNAAAQTAEGAEKAESAITFAEVTQPVSTIAHFLKASRQVLDDNAALSAFIETRLRQGLEAAIETGLVSGGGTGGALHGLLKAGNFTAFTPTVGDTQVDSLRKAKLALESANYRAGLVLLNPSDTAAIELLKTATEEAYLVGRPISGGLATLWGVPVYSTTAITAGNFVMLDPEQAVSLHVRQDSIVEMTDSDTDDFQRNLITIRAEARLALAVQLPAAVRSGPLLAA
jgi:HK97 family phage major capsid protein